MENIIKGLGSWLSLIFNKNSFEVFNKSVQPYIKELNGFHFSYLNPVFIALVLILFLVLSRFWGPKKSFTYCLIVSLVLFLATELNKQGSSTVGESVLTSVDLVNGAAILIIAVVTLFYIFIKGQI